MDKLYNLLREYEGKPVDDLFIEDAFYIMIDREADLANGGYVRDFKVGTIEFGASAAYSRFDKVVLIDKSPYLQLSEPIGKIYAIKSLKHELGHARNLKTTLEGGDDIETLLLRGSNKDFLLTEIVHLPDTVREVEDLRIHKAMYPELDPDERIADIRAWRYIVNMLKNNKGSKELLFARRMLFEAYIRGYKDNGYYLEPPTYEFLFNCGLDRDLRLVKRRMEYKKYSFDTRIELGLPIDYRERRQKVKSKTRLDTYILKDHV